MRIAQMLSTKLLTQILCCSQVSQGQGHDCEKGSSAERSLTSLMVSRICTASSATTGSAPVCEAKPPAQGPHLPSGMMHCNWLMKKLQAAWTYFSLFSTFHSHMIMVLIRTYNLTKSGCGAGQHLIAQPDNATVAIHHHSSEEEQEQVYQFTIVCPKLQKSATNQPIQTGPSIFLPNAKLQREQLQQKPNMLAKENKSLRCKLELQPQTVS